MRSWVAQPTAGVADDLEASLRCARCTCGDRKDEVNHAEVANNLKDAFIICQRAKCSVTERDK
eukprot:scaffold1878_cov355-Prasinococcus_capsulatus_cf.AAC.3